MAFSSTGIKPFARYAGSRTGWTYVSTDTVATITGGNYFNSMAAQMRLGDIIVAVGDSVPAMLAVSSNSGTVVAVTALVGSGGGGGVGAGDIGTVELADNAVTFAKMQNLSANTLMGSVAGGDPAEITCTSAGRALIDDANAAAQLTTLGAQPLDASLTAFAALTTAANRFLTFSAADTPVASTITAAGLALVDDADAAAQRATLSLGTRKFIVLFDGGGAVVPTGVQPAHVQAAVNGTITASSIFADQVGSIVVDVWKDTYANYPPTVADTITGSELPTLAGVNKNQDLNLTTWTTAFNAGDIFRFNVNSAATVTWCLLVIDWTH